MAAPTIVQTSPHTQALATTTAAVTFSSMPAVGNAVVVPLLSWNNAGTTLSCADNRGNAYSLVGTQPGSGAGLAIFYCPTIGATGSPFTVTITALASTYFEVSALEIGNTGGALLLDSTVSASSVSSTTPNTGTTAALTHADVLAVAVVSINLNEASITVQSVSPAWTQIFENLSFSTSVAGEVDTRPLTAVTGTTQSCSWTLASAATSGQRIAIFAPTAGAAATERVQVIVIA